MKLIVEAGSTKTDSILLSNNNKVVVRNKTPGINPVTDQHHLDALTSLTQCYGQYQIDSIHYYGSGCINTEVNEKLRQEIRSQVNREVEISVEDDLIAVGRALCQKNEGIAVILGTGSNTGYYNGSHITDRVKSCGYLLGDEGSGYSLGQSLYRRLARGQLSKISTELILNKKKLVNIDLVEHLYAQINPRQYVASFASGIEHLNDLEKTQVLNDAFIPFFDRVVLPIYEKYQVPVYLSGSICFHFSTELKQLFKKFNIIAASFVESPLEGLIRYHSYE